MEQKTISTMGQERQRLLRLLGWEHGKPLPQLVLGLLGWHYGTNDGKLIPGRSAFGIPVEKIALFIQRYAPQRGNLNKEGPFPEDVQALIQQYGDLR